MKRTTKVVLGIVGLVTVGGVALVASKAAAAPPAGPPPNDDDGKPGTGVRHGVRFQGCEHFDLIDEDEARAWWSTNQWRFAAWILRIDDIAEDPEPFLVDVARTVFPECPWPPAKGTTFGPQRMSWADLKSEAATAVASYLATPEPSRPGPNALFASLATIPRRTS